MGLSKGGQLRGYRPFSWYHLRGGASRDKDNGTGITPFGGSALLGIEYPPRRFLCFFDYPPTAVFWVLGLKPFD